VNIVPILVASCLLCAISCGGTGDSADGSGGEPSNHSGGSTATGGAGGVGGTGGGCGLNTDLCDSAHPCCKTSRDGPLTCVTGGSDEGRCFVVDIR